MSISAVVLDGVRRAATYAAMLFSLNTPDAPAQPPVPAAAQAAPAFDGSIAASGLTLAAHHADVRIVGGRASVVTLLLLRNDTPAGISAQYLLPQPAHIMRGDARELFGRTGAAAVADDRDLSPEAAEAVETSSGRWVQRHDVIVVAPGEQVRIEIEREVPVVVEGTVHRLRMPLPTDPAAPWVPPFTADVLIEADQPIRRLASPTHPVLVDGLGEHTALLSVADGVVHRQAQFTVEFELDTTEASLPALALDRAPVGRNR
jgi:hypothetical protein